MTDQQNRLQSRRVRLRALFYISDNAQCVNQLTLLSKGLLERSHFHLCFRNSVCHSELPSIRIFVHVGPGPYNLRVNATRLNGTDPTETDLNGLHNSSYCDAVTPFSDVAILFSTTLAVAGLPRLAGGTLKQSGKHSGVGTILRIVAALSIVLLAILAVLLVLDIIPRESFNDLSLKLLSVGGIAAVSLIALSFVLRK